MNDQQFTVSVSDLFSRAREIVYAAMDDASPLEFAASDQVSLARWVIEHVHALKATE